MGTRDADRQRGLRTANEISRTVDSGHRRTRHPPAANHGRGTSSSSAWPWPSARASSPWRHGGGQLAGPAISLPFLIAAVACGLAILCYAEFASTLPVAGRAYTFSYASFGEFVAWIIGWDLILEFALGAAVIAKFWALYLADAFGLFGRIPTTPTTLGRIDFDWGAGGHRRDLHRAARPRAPS